MSAVQAWGTMVAGLPHSLPRGGQQGHTSAPPHPVPRTGNLAFTTISFITLFFFFFLIYTKHTAELYTNKPRALLMQQALYNEPKRARLLWEDGLSVQTLGGFPLQKTKLSLYRSPWICTCPNHPSPVFNRQCTQVHLTDQWWPATLADSHNVSSALLADKGIDYQILQRI